MFINKIFMVFMSKKYLWFSINFVIDYPSALGTAGKLVYRLGPPNLNINNLKFLLIQTFVIIIAFFLSLQW